MSAFYALEDAVARTLGYDAADDLADDDATTALEAAWSDLDDGEPARVDAGGYVHEVVPTPDAVCGVPGPTA